MKKFILPAALAAMLACGTPAAFAQEGGKAYGNNASQTQGKTIVEIAAGNEDFSTLVTAVKAANLAEKLSGKGPFTVFAPTNAAFAKVPKDQLEALLKPENREKLQDVLLYHVVAGKVTAADVVKVDEAKAANGDAIKVSTKGKDVMLNGSAKVVKTDIMASNGVIHVIDAVILPPMEGDSIKENAKIDPDKVD